MANQIQNAVNMQGQQQAQPAPQAQPEQQPEAAPQSPGAAPTEGTEELRTPEREKMMEKYKKMKEAMTTPSSMIMMGVLSKSELALHKDPNVRGAYNQALADAKVKSYFLKAIGK